MSKGYLVTTMEYCTMVDTSQPVTAPEYKVHIAKIMPNIKVGSPSDESVTIAKDRIVNKKFNAKGSVATANYVVAKSATPFRTNIKGQVFKMSGSKGETEKDTIIWGELKTHKIEPPHVGNHKHLIEKPLEFYDMVYTDLDEEVTVETGDKMIGHFIGGNLNDYWVTHILDKLPKE